jgi:hypothetical protein
MGRGGNFLPPTSERQTSQHSKGSEAREAHGERVGYKCNPKKPKSSTCGAYLNALKTREALCPPNPRLFEIATLTVILRAWLGT